MEEIIRNMNLIYPLPDELELLLRKTIRRDEIRKKQKLLRPDQVCTRLYFIEQGLVHLYVKHGKKERSSWFMLEGDIVTSVTSFFERTPSLETIQALEDCILWSLSSQELLGFYERFPGFRKVGQYYTEKYYCQDDRLKIMLQTKSPADFYNYLQTNFPKVVDRVPNKYLASLMGITVQTLRPIKKQIKEGEKPDMDKK